ncbi:MAG TPA: TAXI family TRAP transporter solute-binding subunit [Firmicutes bacterium]|nr:TAXI family TRAP transporter solute-binding subunit [Bacillota bacterium]
MMRRLLLSGVVVCLVLIMAVPSLAATAQLVMATGGTAGTYYPLGGAMSQIINSKVKDVSVSVQSTGASVANIRMIENGEVDLALVQTDIADYAWNGTEMFKDGGKLQKFAVIASLYPELIQVVVREESGIDSIADLKGKKVSVGAPGSGTEANARQLLETYGLAYKDLGQVQYLSFAESAEAFKDRHIDAFFVTAGIPNAGIQDTATMHKIKVLFVTDEMFKKLHSTYGFYGQATIPADCYINQTELVQTVAVQAVLIARRDLDTDAVYKMTAALFDNLPELATSHAKGKEISLEGALTGVSTPLHPGAEKYFREKGIVK